MRGHERWRFGHFVADAREQQLTRDGQVVTLTHKAFTLLATLLGRPGQLITKAELFDTVWAGRVVTDAALSRSIHELRAALGDDASAPRFIATVHGLGFRFIAPVASEGAGAAGALTPEGADRRLVGRDAELQRLEQALADAHAGRRQLIFVTGEAGIGKTSLVEAFLERYAPAWLAQLPWLANDADRALLRDAEADPTPQRMLREIAQALEMLAAEAPIVLWLEDLHWSDPSSLAVVSFMAGRRDAARLLLIGSFRPADAQAIASPLQGLALSLAQRGQADELALAALDEAAVKRFLALRIAAARGMRCSS
jgi:DNA-binding winged helix-turn-helix (wHTH) protein